MDISQCYAWFVYTDKLPLLSSLNTTRLVTISEYYHCGVSSLSLHTFDHLSPFHSDSEPPFLAGSFWMLFVALFLSYLRTHKNAGIFFFLGGILTFIMYIFCLESMHCIKLHMVWTRNFFFFCYANWLVPATVTKQVVVIFFSFFFFWVIHVVKKMRMYLSLLDCYYIHRPRPRVWMLGQSDLT